MARRIEIEIVADASRLGRTLRESSASMGGFVRNLERTGRGGLAGTVAITGMGRAIAFASAQFLGGYGLAFALSHSTDAAIKFQQQMLLIKTQAGDLTGNIAQLSQQVLKLAPEVATSPEMLSKGLYHIESAGIRGGKALKELRVAAMGAKIGMDDLENVTNALVAAQASGLKGTKDLSHAMGVLDAITGAGNLRLADLTKALHSGITGTARQVGISLEDLGGALSVLTIRGVPAQQAATRLRTALALLASPTAKAQKELKEIGIGPLELAKVLNRGGLLPALTLLSDKLKASGKSAEGMTATIVRAFGAARSSSTIIQLLQSLDGLQSGLDRIQVGTAKFGDKWKAQMQTAQFASDRLKASAATLEIFIGQALLPTFQHVADHLSHWLAQSKNQERVQRDLKKVIATVEEAFHALGSVIKFVSDSVGGLHNAVLLLLGLKTVSVLSAWGNTAAAAAKKFWLLATAETAASKELKALAAVQAAAAGEMALPVGVAAGKRRAAESVAAKAEGGAVAFGGGAMARGPGGRFVGVAGSEKQVARAQAEAAKAARAVRDAEIAAAAALADYTGATAASAAVHGKESIAEAKLMGSEVELMTADKLLADARVRAAVATDALRAAEETAAAERVATGGGVPVGAVGTAGRGVAAGEGVTAAEIGAAGLVPSLAKAGSEAEKTAPKFARLVEKFPLLGTRITTMTGALGSAGLAGAALVASYEVTTLGLKLSGLSGLLRDSSGAFQKAVDERRAGKMSQEIRTFSPTVSAKLKFDLKFGDAKTKAWAQTQINKIFANAPAQVAKRIAEGFLQAQHLPLDLTPRVKLTAMGRAGMLKTVKDSLSVEKLEAYLRATLHIPKDAAHVFAVNAINQLKGELAAQKLVASITTDLKPKVVSGNFRTDKSDFKRGPAIVLDQITVPNQQADRASRLAASLAAAQLEVAKGDTAANAKVVAILRQQISEDEKYVKIQERLMLKGGVDANKHAATLVKLRNDEAAAYAQIASVTKNIFELPVRFQLAQAKAATTPGMTDDRAASQATKTWLQKIIRSGKLHGQDLVTAYQELASAQQALVKQITLPTGLQLKEAAAQVRDAMSGNTNASAAVNKQIAAWARQQLKNTKLSQQDRIALLGILAGAIQSSTKAVETPLKLQVGLAEAQLTKSQMDDLVWERRIRDFWKRQLARAKRMHDLGAELTAATNLKTAEDAISGATGVATAYTATSSHRLTAGLNLPRDQRIALEQRIAQSESHDGRRPRHGAYGALGFPVGNVTININGGDPAAVEATVMKVINRTDRLSAPQRRGRYGGRH